MPKFPVRELCRNCFAAGDDSSLLKAITVDKSLIYSDAVKDRFMKAHFSGDTVFIKKVGKAVSVAPLKKEAQHGINIYTVKELLGHKDLRMTVRYCHLAPENLRNAISVLDKKESCYNRWRVSVEVASPTGFEPVLPP